MGFVDELRACYFTTGHHRMGKDAIAANKMTIKSQAMKLLWTVKEHAPTDVSGACMCADVGLCYQCTLLPLCLCEEQNLRMHICIAKVYGSV